jgi:hypothetical protein
VGRNGDFVEVLTVTNPKLRAADTFSLSPVIKAAVGTGEVESP